MGDQFLLTLANMIFHRPDEVIVREALEEEAALRRPCAGRLRPCRGKFGRAPELDTDHARSDA